MSRQDIADYLGPTSETVSRTSTRLEHDGAIKIISGGMGLLHPARAEALAAPERIDPMGQFDPYQRPSLSARHTSQEILKRF